jgi:hypothetical protein
MAFLLAVGIFFWRPPSASLLQFEQAVDRANPKDLTKRRRHA